MERKQPNLPTRISRRLWGWTHRFDASGNKRDRAVQLFTTVAVTVLVLGFTDWVTESGLFRNLFFPALGTTPQVQAWSARVYAAIFVLGLPVAFLLWHWRDRNMRDQIENARKDINLKEFQEVQLRAADALDTNLPEVAREQLQIAALHQLRGFLRGDYGDSFRRPAFELLLAFHRSMGERLKAPRFRAQASKTPPDGDWSKKGEEIREHGRRLRDWQSSLERSAGEVIWSEWRAIWRSGFPLTNRTLDLIAIPPRAQLSKLDLSGAQLAGAFLSSVQFEGAILSKAHLQGAVLDRAHLEGAFLGWAHLECANLIAARLQRANLGLAHLEGALLIGARLDGANLSGAQLQGANLALAFLEGAELREAVFDDQTQLTDDWATCSPEDRAAAQQKLRDLGARHVDDPPAGETQGAVREDGAGEVGG